MILPAARNKPRALTGIALADHSRQILIALICIKRMKSNVAELGAIDSFTRIDGRTKDIILEHGAPMAMRPLRLNWLG